jgi:excisionase family DNA binding protein
MESIKVDIRDLRTVENYSKEYTISKPTIYKMIKDKELKTVRVDGKLFIKLK